MMRRTGIIAILLLAALNGRAQVYVSTDKSCYLAGEHVWCSVFCAEGPSVAYLELVSSEGTAVRSRIDVRKGRGGGSLLLPVSIPTGNYKLFAYSGPSDAAFGGPLLSVFNPFTTDRVKDGVEIVEPEGYVAEARVPAGYGLTATTSGTVVLENTSGKQLSCCVSLTRSDSIKGAGYRSIASFNPGKPRPEEHGEVLRAKLEGPDAAIVAGEEVAAIIAVPGAKTDCYTAHPSADGSVLFETENIFGEADMVCLLEGLDPERTCHMELESPFVSPRADDLPKLQLCRTMESDLLRRTSSLLKERASDTLATTLPMRRNHFMLTHECITYVLDDYTRFPTMEEVFVEITPTVKLRRRGGKPKIYVLMNNNVVSSSTVWGDAVVMIDGVPVPDHKLIETYDPAIVKAVEVYPYRYNFGYRIFDGVVNLVTFKGNMPGVLFDDNVRIYDFQGCSWPMSHQGEETVYWHPLVSLAPGEKLELPAGGMVPGVEYSLSVEGLTAEGRAVYLRKTFLR